MTTTSTPVDLNAIHPDRGDKYSPNLYKWLTSRRRKPRADRVRVYRSAEGALYIGTMDGEDDYAYLHGSRLMGVLCNGSREKEWAYGPAFGMVEIPDFWPRYAEIGRCAMDPDHRMFFIGGEHRYTIRENGMRRCEWCFQLFEAHTETKTTTTWVPLGTHHVGAPA